MVTLSLFEAQSGSDEHFSLVERASLCEQVHTSVSPTEDGRPVLHTLVVPLRKGLPKVGEDTCHVVRPRLLPVEPPRVSKLALPVLSFPGRCDTMTGGDRLLEHVATGENILLAVKDARPCRHEYADTEASLVQEMEPGTARVRDTRVPEEHFSGSDGGRDDLSILDEPFPFFGGMLYPFLPLRVELSLLAGTGGVMGIA